MIAVVDVDYRAPNRAVAACVLAAGWNASAPERTVAAETSGVAPYRPGRFFERELPALLAVLARVDVQLDAIVIDGLVWLDPDATRPGLGARLHQALGGRVPVVGVAKTRFRTATCAQPLLRGQSRTPLWITSAGMRPEEALRRVRSMHGPHRIPTLLRLADRVARDAP